MKVGYWATSKICKGVGAYFRGYLLCVEAYRIYSGIMSHFFTPKIRPQNLLCCIHRIV